MDKNQEVEVHRGPYEERDHPWSPVGDQEEVGHPSLDLLQVESSDHQDQTSDKHRNGKYHISDQVAQQTPLTPTHTSLTSLCSCSPAVSLFSLYGPSALTHTQTHICQ